MKADKTGLHITKYSLINKYYLICIQLNMISQQKIKKITKKAQLL